MLAYPPFEFSEETYDLTRDQFKNFLASFDRDTVDNNDIEIVRFELTWDKNKMVIKMLHKHKEKVATAPENNVIVDPAEEARAAPEAAPAP